MKILKIKFLLGFNVYTNVMPLMGIKNEQLYEETLSFEIKSLNNFLRQFKFECNNLILYK